MNNKKSTSLSLAASVLGLALISTTNPATAASTERCADIVKGGKNTCAVASLGISCQGNARNDNMIGAWIKVPTGTCTSIVSICNSSSTAPEGTDSKRLKKACDKIAVQTEASVTGGRLVDENGVSL